jgi:hypothetical protein
VKRVLALALMIGSAHAEFVDGNKLLSNMKDSSYYMQGHALGYIVGVADTGVGIIHCAPYNATAGQMHDMVKNYLENTPADRHLSGDTVINKVLKAVWPCAKRGNSM